MDIILEQIYKIIFFQKLANYINAKEEYEKIKFLNLNLSYVNFKIFYLKIKKNIN